jgi:hypothetical protein
VEEVFLAGEWEIFELLGNSVGVGHVFEIAGEMIFFLGLFYW